VRFVVVVPINDRYVNVSNIAVLCGRPVYGIVSVSFGFIRDDKPSLAVLLSEGKLKNKQTNRKQNFCDKCRLANLTSAVILSFRELPSNVCSVSDIKLKACQVGVPQQRFGFEPG
jgi:hypothetical protein